MSNRWLAYFAVAGFSVGMVLSSCGTPVARCLPSNCAGCCSADGQCLKGTNVKACGARGAVCEDCGSAGTCEMQKCVTYTGDGGYGGGDDGTGGGGTGGGSATAGGRPAGGIGGSSGTAGGGNTAGGATAGGATAGGATAGGATAGGATAGGATAGGATAGGATAGGATAGGATAGGATAGGATAGGATAGGATAGGAAPSGTGLRGQYFGTTRVYQVPAVTRTDATVDFAWGTAAPIAGIPADNFSVLWTGFVEPQFNETYTFYLQSDDGCQVWVNGVSIIDDWVVRSAPVELSGTIALQTGFIYDIRIEYFSGTGNAQARLSWSSPSQPKQVIPQARLYGPMVVPGGLWGDYWDTFNGVFDYLGRRSDGPINFLWSSSGPGTLTAPNTGLAFSVPFSTDYQVRWMGTVLPPVTGTYTFYTQSDDGVMLFVNGVQVINNWTDHGSVENTGTIALTANQRVNIRLDYYQNEVDAEIRLSWSAPGLTKQLVPAAALSR